MSTERGDRDAGVQVEAQWPKLPDGDYEGVILKCERGPSPWASRKLTTWERDERRAKRRDWGAYYHVELGRALAAAHHRYLAQWTNEHRGRPIVFHACRYSTLEGSTKPLPPARSSNLWKLLTLARPGTSMVGEFVPFILPVGMVRISVIVITQIAPS